MSRGGSVALWALAAAAAQTPTPAPLPNDSLQRPGVLIREMKLEPGMTVADIGTGIGNMLPLAEPPRGSDGTRTRRGYRR